MEKTDALLHFFREMAGWMEIQARDYENGAAVHFTGQIDDSQAAAARLRHKAGNILSVIDSYNRLRARE
jgi:hypothetical protein